MVTSTWGIYLIETLEGREHAAYQDGHGEWTIGVGHKLSGPSSDLTWTDEQIENQLHADLATAEHAVNSLQTPLSQPQFDACVSLAFNIGAGAFTHSIIATNLRKLRYRAAADAFELWNDRGLLTNRRKAERGVFLYGTKP